MPVNVGVMAKPPVPGRCKTRMSPPLTPEAAADLYSAMLRDSLAAYARAGADRYVIMAAPEDDGEAILSELAPGGWELVVQRGADLGARLAHAFSVLGEGGGAVALLDSDSPTVPVQPMGAALAEIEGREQALVGPCDDGGYYLIGLGHVTERSLGILSDITWSTGAVMDQTRARCEALGIPLTELETWYDVDDEACLARIHRELQQDPTRAPRTAAWIEEFAAEVIACASR